MQFQIPQFIEIEDKIAGPFSLRQLLFVVAGGVVTFLAFTALPFFAALIIGLIAIGGSLAFALIKINGQPLTRVAFAAAGFFWKPRLYLWKRESKERTIEMPEFEGLKGAPVSEDRIVDQRNMLKKFTTQMPSINKLSGDLNTSKNPIPRREKTAPDAIAMFRKKTGEKQTARRVDFR